MRTVRIYQPGSYEPGETLELSSMASRHVGLVLRMASGEALTLFCGDNREFSATIQTVSKHKVMVLIEAVRSISRESPAIIHLAQGLSKGDRFEWVVQKATELGVASVTPLITAHGVVRLDSARLSKKQAQWQSIAISACEQSGRNQIPLIHDALPLTTYLKHCSASNKFVLDPNASQPFQKVTSKPHDFALLIGPEGGLASEEVAFVKSHEFIPMRLGPRILRTETAAIVALGVLQYTAGDI